MSEENEKDWSPVILRNSKTGEIKCQNDIINPNDLLLMLIEKELTWFNDRIDHAENEDTVRKLNEEKRQFKRIVLKMIGIDPNKVQELN